MGDRVVLEAGDDDQVALTVTAAHSPGRRHDAERVGFRCPRGEDDLVDVRAQGASDLFARVVEHATGPPPSEVEGGGIAGSCSQVTLGAGPRVKRTLAQRRRGRVVEVNAHA